jgi:GT2 family glycosyltransferase
MEKIDTWLDPQFSVIIVNFNVRYFLEQVLLSVRRASKGLRVEVIVVDNCSSDDSNEMVKQQFSEVYLIENQTNVGFSKANNQGIVASRGKYILLLNPDTVLAEDTLQKCWVYMESHPSVGGMGIRMIDGSGRFLPESKRGFPSPWVAFCKAFGLSALFPKSQRFNTYSLGHLSELETNEADVLAGAFMLMPRAVLDKIGLLDETFFMYGEDIDLSYRIVKEGFKNIYFADSTIIHYKGESTKKGSLNYVKIFYNAMIIFAKKHFKGEQAKIFITLMQMAIYFRAFLTIFSNALKIFKLPLLDAGLLFVGLSWLKNIWASNYFDNPNYYNYYNNNFLYINTPIYISVWLVSIFLSGGYDAPLSLRRLLRGGIVGAIFWAAIYGFLPLEYRFSRALLLLGAVWGLMMLVIIRYLFHFLAYKNFKISDETPKNLLLIGSVAETQRAKHLLNEAQVRKNIIGIVAPIVENQPITHQFLGDLTQLAAIVRIYRINEIIFCSKDILNKDIIRLMAELRKQGVEFKILPEGSQSIIGSHDKNARGELYTVDPRFRLAAPMHRRHKRLFDVILAFILFLFLPVNVWFMRDKFNFIKNIFQVFIGKKTWVGYASDVATCDLPNIAQAVLSPRLTLEDTPLSNDRSTLQKLNFLYAKNYEFSDDLRFVFDFFKYLDH